MADIGGFFSDFFKEIEDKARNAITTRRRQFLPKDDITVKELAYVISHSLHMRQLSDKEWNEHDESIMRHFGP